MGRGVYHLLDVEVGLSAPDAMIDVVDALYGAFRTPCSCPVCAAAGGQTLDLTVEPQGTDTVHIHCGAFAWPVPASLASSMILALIQNRGIARSRAFHAIHGAAAAIGDRGTLLVAASETGKTTLSLELQRRGHRLLSDEIAAIAAGAAGLHPFPRNLAVREPSLQLPGGPRPPVLRWIQFGGERKAVVDAGWTGGGPHPDRLLPDTVILLGPEHDPSIRRDPAESVLELALGVEGDGFADGLASWHDVKGIERLPPPRGDTMRIRYRSGAALVAEIDELARRTGTLIRGHFRGASLPVDYRAPPRWETLSGREGVFGILPSVLNGKGREPGRLVIGLSTVFASSRWYRVVPGRLAETADLVEALCRGEGKGAG